MRKCPVCNMSVLSWTRSLYTGIMGLSISSCTLLNNCRHHGAASCKTHQEEAINCHPGYFAFVSSINTEGESGKFPPRFCSSLFGEIPARLGARQGQHRRGRQKTSSTTSEIQGGCATIYNLAGSLLCDSGESESGTVNSRAEERPLFLIA